MILHIIPDSGFTDFVINKFNSIDPGKHTFFINSINTKLRFTKNKKIQRITREDLLSNTFISSLNKYDAIVLHSLSSRYLKKMVMRAPLDVTFVWLGWGGDYYETIPKLKLNLYGESTLKLMNSMFGFKGKIKEIIKTLIPSYDIKPIDIYNKVDYFGPIIYDEYNLLEEVLSPAHTKYIPFSYGQLENDLLKGIEHLEIKGDNILLGNSASFSNNHLEILEFLSRLNLGDKKIITPLSYGNKKYANEIISFGQKVTGYNFSPQMEFIDKESYHKLISSCSICIMNHKRQQSMGNIISMLYLGSKLFMNKENIVYKFLKREGAIIFSIDELDNESISIKLTKSEILTNRNVLKKHWSESVVNEKYRSFIDLIKSKR